MIKYSPTPDYTELKTYSLVGASAVEIDVPVSNPSSSQTTIDDAVIGDDDVAVVDHVWDISPNNLESRAEYESLTPEIATVNSSGFLTRVSNGTAGILIKMRGGDNRRFNLEISRTIGENLFDSWVNGSLADHITEIIQGFIGGKTPTSNTLNIFTSATDTGTPLYTRNPNLFCAEIQEKLTGCNVWQSGYGDGLSRAQTAITPRHIIGAAHYGVPITIGGTQRFVAADGTIVDRTVTHTYSVPSTDIQISLLSSDLPNTITPLSVLPNDIRDYISQIQHGVPCIIRNQFREIRIFDLNRTDSVGVSFSSTTMRDGRLDWQRTLVAGDSGGPAMILINGQLALVTTWTSSISGPQYFNRDWSSIITTLDALAGINTGYTPSVINLSAFPNYT
jgi:hypothetical protein